MSTANILLCALWRDITQVMGTALLLLNLKETVSIMNVRLDVKRIDVLRVCIWILHTLMLKNLIELPGLKVTFNWLGFVGPKCKVKVFFSFYFPQRKNFALDRKENATS